MRIDGYKAEKDFNKSINSEYPDARVFIALGIYKYENGENEKALELLKKKNRNGFYAERISSTINERYNKIIV